MSTTFPQPVVFEVLRHLVLDHADDSLLIVQALGSRPDAHSALPVDLDGAGIEFLVNGNRNGGSDDGGSDGDRVRIPWPHPISERSQLRTSCIALYEQACHTRGITPRVSDAQGAE
ncbi:DUF2470 domain-containing protein [Nonomuraea sp. NPDC050663]|uniref:DUF2470 domain-containing protein n=1 Tax=Nonomuraea sp. NPDC050663 TaxID=3364370 RepID=UPI00378CC684